MLFRSPHILDLDNFLLKKSREQQHAKDTSRNGNPREPYYELTYRETAEYDGTLLYHD